MIRDWRERLNNSNPSKMEIELALRLQKLGVRFTSQVEIPVTTADFYVATNPRATLVFVDGPPHLKASRASKDEEVRSLLRKRGYHVLEVPYLRFSKRTVEDCLKRILEGIHADNVFDITQGEV